jgi:hypothetical protein
VFEFIFLSILPQVPNTQHYLVVSLLYEKDFSIVPRCTRWRRQSTGIRIPVTSLYAEDVTRLITVYSAITTDSHSRHKPHAKDLLLFFSDDEDVCACLVSHHCRSHNEPKAMTTPAILYSDVPKVKFWGSTAPSESKDESDNECDNECYDYFDDDDEAVMETIFSDPCMDYVMVPTDVSFDSDDSVPLALPAQSRNGSSSFRVFLKRCNSYLFSENSWWTRLYDQSKESSQQALPSSPSKATKRSYTGPARGSAIYSSYDWVSEVVIDKEGRRLILPGQLVVLDPEPSMNSILSSSSSDSTDLPTHIDYASLFGSSTIMVSAHDLLATRNNSNNNNSTTLDNNADYPTIEAWATHLPPLPTSRTNTNISKALWKLASRKYQSAQDTVVHSSTALVNSLTRRLVTVEQHLHVLSMTSDIVIQGYDWCFPSPPPPPTTTVLLDELEHKLEPNPPRRNCQRKAQQPIVTLEMGNRQGGGDSI